MSVGSGSLGATTALGGRGSIPLLKTCGLSKGRVTVGTDEPATLQPGSREAGAPSNTDGRLRQKNTTQAHKMIPFFCKWITPQVLTIGPLSPGPSLKWHKYL